VSAVVGSLSIEGIEKQFDGTDVLRGVDLDVAPGSMCVVLGPSGSGKTTLLRLIAGLESADAGRITLGGRVLTDVTRGVDLRPERRRIGMVFQDWALFPHLTVAENVAFGLGRRETSNPRVAEVLEMVGLGGYARRTPGTLSGGQQQRIALARALAPRPEVLLLDEPFSNLDVALRVRVRTEVHRLLAEAGVTAVFVTHDQQEAFVLGDQVVVMRDGLVVQASTPAVLYSQPVDAWVASFVGDANLLPGQARDGIAMTELGPIDLAAPAHGSVEVLVRPEHLTIVDGDAATVELVEFYGHDAIVVVRLDSGLAVRVRTQQVTVASNDRVAVRHDRPSATAFPLSGDVTVAETVARS
jgi:iron(III) transport system ATP-binding protein